jgi:hypothetical protein
MIESPTSGDGERKYEKGKDQRPQGFHYSGANGVYRHHGGHSGPHFCVPTEFFDGIISKLTSPTGLKYIGGQGQR